MTYKLIFDFDSYKSSHNQQLPEGTTRVLSYIESRKAFSPTSKGAVFFGLQRFIEEYLTSPESVITQEDVTFYRKLCDAHGIPANVDGWSRIVSVHGGRLPIEITALPEGTVTPTGIPMVQIINTDPALPWLTSFVETALLRSIWYPTTVATLSREIKVVLKQYLDETADNADGIDFMLHDFGSRGVSSQESAAIGGMAHLVNFKGTDTFVALMDAFKFYGHPMAGFSIPASEHSTMTAWGKDSEVEAYRNMLQTYKKPGAIFACVSDSYDLYNAIENIWGGVLHDEVVALGEVGAKLVIRPDSGRPEEVVPKVLEILWNKFGGTFNTKNYRKLPPYIGVIQGDGINYGSINRICQAVKDAGFSIDNLAFGMGGALLQQVNRDSLGFAMKACAVEVNGEWRDINKSPVTDNGKSSKKGYQFVHRSVIDNDLYNVSVKMSEVSEYELTQNLLKIAYRLTSTGLIETSFTSFEEIRARAVV